MTDAPALDAGIIHWPCTRMYRATPSVIRQSLGECLDPILGFLASSAPTEGIAENLAVDTHKTSAADSLHLAIVCKIRTHDGVCDLLVYGHFHDFLRPYELRRDGRNHENHHYCNAKKDPQSTPHVHGNAQESW